MGKVQKMADKLLCENEKSMAEIINKLQSVKKKVEQMPPHPIVRAVDLPFDEAIKYALDMERMRESYETDDGRRRRRYE